MHSAEENRHGVCMCVTLVVLSNRLSVQWQLLDCQQVRTGSLPLDFVHSVVQTVFKP